MRSGPARRKSSKVKVRSAQRADLDALMELEQRVFATDRLSRASMRRLLASPTANVMVAEISTQLAGAAVILFRPRSTVARLYSIAVAPHMSGQGVAPALLAAVEAAASADKCRCVRLEVHEKNAAAIARYGKSGYHPFGRRTAYYDDGGDALRFEKVLSEPVRGRR